jgi:predicted AAA+ superfamily ATPase
LCATITLPFAQPRDPFNVANLPHGAASPDLSFTWRLDFIRSYLEHDVGMFVPRVASTTLQRLWAMLANDQGALLNASRLAESLMVSGASIARYIDLLAHSAVGGSWEGFVMEQLIAAAPQHTAPYFYRTARGAEIDLLLDIPKHGLWVFEIKRSRAPSLKKGFYTACEDLAPARRMLVYPGDTVYTIKQETEVMPIWAALQALRALHPGRAVP